MFTYMLRAAQQPGQVNKPSLFQSSCSELSLSVCTQFISNIVTQYEIKKTIFIPVQAAKIKALSELIPDFTEKENIYSHLVKCYSKTTVCINTARYTLTFNTNITNPKPLNSTVYRRQKQSVLLCYSVLVWSSTCSSASVIE